MVGYYVKAEKLDGSGYEHFIIEESKDGATYEILPETLCEYTNRKDINGKQIFENDIVRTKYGRICRVCWVSVGIKDSGVLCVLGGAYDLLEGLLKKEGDKVL